MKQECGETLGDLEPVYHLFTSAITLSQSVTCGIHPKQHTKKRGALGNTKKDKPTRRRAGMWVEEVYGKDSKGSTQN